MCGLKICEKNSLNSSLLLYDIFNDSFYEKSLQCHKCAVEHDTMRKSRHK